MCSDYLMTNSYKPPSLWPQINGKQTTQFPYQPNRPLKMHQLFASLIEQLPEYKQAHVQTSTMAGPATISWLRFNGFL